MALHVPLQALYGFFIWYCCQQGSIPFCNYLLAGVIVIKAVTSIIYSRLAVFSAFCIVYLQCTLFKKTESYWSLRCSGCCSRLPSRSRSSRSPSLRSQTLLLSSRCSALLSVKILCHYLKEKMHKNAHIKSFKLELKETCPFIEKN